MLDANLRTNISLSWNSFHSHPGRNRPTQCCESHADPRSSPYDNDQGRLHKHGAVLGPRERDRQQWGSFALVSMPV